MNVMIGPFQVGTNYCVWNGSTLSMPTYSRDSWHRVTESQMYVQFFWAQRSPERFGTVPNGSAYIILLRILLPTASKPTKKGQEHFPLFFFQVPVSKFFKDPPSGSKDQGYKSKESEKRLKRLLRDLDVVPCGWGPYCKTLNRQCRRMVKTREKVKLDGEYKRLDVS